MRRSRFWLMGALAAVGLAACATPHHHRHSGPQGGGPGMGPGAHMMRPTSEWTALFDGLDLDDWTFHVVGAEAPNMPLESVFTIEEGMLHLYRDTPLGVTVTQGFIQTKDAYGDVTISLEYRWGEKKFAPRLDQPRDSGLIYVNHGPLGAGWPRGVENQIQENDTGDVWTSSTQVESSVNPQSRRYAPSEEGGAPVTVGAFGAGANIKRGPFAETNGWNHVEVVLRGDSAVQVLNDQVVMRITNMRQWDETSASWLRLDRGRISIQAEAAEMYIRNIRVRPVSEDDPS